MTPEELYALQVAMKIRHNWSDKQFALQMEIMSALFPDCTQFPTSLYHAKKALQDLCTIAPTYVVYCRNCLETVARSKDLVKEANCPTCNLSLTHDLQEGDLQFVTMPISDQIRSFAEEENFKHTVRNFSRHTYTHMQGAMHGDNVKKKIFDLTLCMDGSQLHRKSGNGSLPAYLLLNNVPLNYQTRYPILGAIFVGKKEHQPPREVFLRDMVTELTDLSENPIQWVDDIGNEVESPVRLTTCETDAVEKSAVMCHVAHSAFFSCHFCEMKGETLTEAKYEDLWKADFRLRKTRINQAKPDVIAGGPRFPKSIWEERAKMRDGQARLRTGMKALRLQLAKRKPSLALNGIKGTPAISGLPHFDPTNSHVADTLHGICHGIFQDIMKKVVGGFGADHNLARTAARDFTTVDSKQATLTRTSEVERNCLPISLFHKWNAYDELQFILHSTALICSDPLELRNHNVYVVLVHLANIVYLSHHGRVTEAIIQKVEEEIKAFYVALRETFKQEYLTHKVHVMQHIPHFMRMHGSAMWTDGFNMERLNLFTRNLTNATNNELVQIVRNFIIKYHGSAFKNVNEFQRKVQALLHNMGVDTTIFGYHFCDKVRKEHAVQVIPNEAKELIIQEIVTRRIATRNFAAKNLKRLISINRKGVILETREAWHPNDSMVRNSYIQVNDSCFGQIAEIVATKVEANPEEEKFIFVMTKFRKVPHIQDSEGAVILYPINQFPYVEPHTGSGNTFVFTLDDATFIQKAHIGELKYEKATEWTKLFTVSPNGDFHM